MILFLLKRVIKSLLNQYEPVFFIPLFLITQNANNIYTIPRQNAAITSVAKCTFNIILLRPIATETDNKKKTAINFQLRLIDNIHIRYPNILQKTKEENECPLGKL